MIAREERLEGATYCARLADGKPLYITINESDGKPYEVFIRIDDPELFEWVIALTVVITRCLRAGESLSNIAQDLIEIHSPASSHHIPGGGGFCTSLAARIGKVLQSHKQLYAAQKGLHNGQGPDNKGIE